MCQQAVALKDDMATVEQMYAIVNRRTDVIEARVPDLPSAITALARLQTLLNEAKANASGIVEFNENLTD